MECLRDEFTSGVILDGRYETLAPLNHGSFGMVFKARDMVTGDTVAIKCVTKRSAADEAGFEFAIDEKSEELVLHRRLGRHPNIVNLVDSFETDAHVYLVLEYCQQGDLYEAIRVDQGPLETEHVRRFMLELVDAVAYIHSKGVYHRDIKPENIFLSKDGAVKLGDFGLASTDKWSFENAVGSDRYMSPEQYDSAGAGYSPAQADIWAVGICLLNILFSRNPFITPTEADPLFLDFSRDKQSLFDVFPSMSQDTYEVIVECMNLDPRKRSLVGARRALNRVISFTTMDEGDDEFCCVDRHTIATANREPLRTPSIQSPQVDTGAFPWAKALHSTTAAQPIRQLSVIPDNESYTEDLFSNSVATADWTSSVQTPSTASILGSGLPASMQSLTINRPNRLKPAVRVSPMAGSLPISMSKPRNIPSMASVFGGKDTVSKSWSDLWEEEEEEHQEEERARQLRALKKMNSRTWSQDSKAEDDDTPRQGLSPAVKSSILAKDSDVPLVEEVIDMDGDLPDGFFFQDVTPVKLHELHPRQSPPPKRDVLEKWAKLGERRRAFTGTKESMPKPDFTLKSEHLTGNVLNYGVFGDHASTNFNNLSFANHHNYAMNNKYQNPTRVKECPWGKSKSRDLNWNWRREKRLGDMEWVGASWQEAHS